MASSTCRVAWRKTGRGGVGLGVATTGGACLVLDACCSLDRRAVRAVTREGGMDGGP